MRGPPRPGMEPRAAVRRASPSPSASSTAFVISSTNRGMPSVRSTISAITSAGSSLFPTRRAMMAAASRSPSRLSVRLVTCDRPTHGGVELGAESYDEQHRKGFNSVHRPTERFQARGVGPMRILEDHQHRLLACQPRNLCGQALPAFFACAVPGSTRSRDNVHHSAATASRQRVPRPQCEVEVCASTASSLSSLACGVSSCANPAARSIWPMIG